MARSKYLVDKLTQNRYWNGTVVQPHQGFNKGIISADLPFEKDMNDSSPFTTACKELIKLPSVEHTSKNSFRIGSKVFIRYEHTKEGTSFGFKLLQKDADQACSKYKCCEPMKFGNMGKKGWVEISITGKRQLPVLLRLARKSRELYD